MRRALQSIPSIALLAILLAGCGDGSSSIPEPHPLSGPLKTTADLLTAAELDLFLKIVHAHPQQRAPEFSPPDEDGGVREGESVAALIDEARTRFRSFYDPQRQGAVWARDPEWSHILHQQQIAPAEFAALVSRVSCAIARVRLEGRADLGELSRLAKQEINELSGQLDERPRPLPQVDQQPIHGTRDPRASIAQRTQSLIQLSRDVALLEFAEMLSRVPPESCSIVKKYAPQLRPLLPRGKKDPFAELVEWQRQRSGTIIHASHDQIRR